jgi:hypothetical protein
MPISHRLRPQQRRRVFSALAALLLSSFMLTPRAEACSCVDAASPCAALGSDEVIFTATPTSLTAERSPDGRGFVRVALAVHDQFNGQVGTAVTVETAESEGACGFPFRRGVKYLVYAHRTATGLHVSLCSRTAPLSERLDDVELLRETAAGQPRRRISGAVLQSTLLLDGFYMHDGPLFPLPDVPVSVHGPDGFTREVRSNRDGQFTLVGVPRGTYEFEAQLPPPYQVLFSTTRTATLDDCLVDVPIFTARVPLSGVVHQSDGRPAPRGVGLRIALLDRENRIAFDRSTMIFARENGRWNLPGLPSGRYVIGINVLNAPSPTSPYPATWFPGAQRVEDANVLVIDDRKTRSIDITLPPPLALVEIVGQVVNDLGNAMSGVSVAIYDDDDPQAGKPYEGSIARTTTDAGGRFTLMAVAGRRYHAEASAPSEGATPGRQSNRVAVSMADPLRPSVTITFAK